MMQRFTDKSIIVVGGTSGIGFATATRFAEEGARVCIFGHSEGVADQAARLPGGKASGKRVDVRDSAATSAAIDAVTGEHDGLDVLVNNAGTAVMGAPQAISDEDWRNVHATNVDGMFYAVRAAISHLEKSGGCIVNTSSVSGIRGDWGMLAYNTSKGAVSNMTRALALDLGPRGIRVNAVAPSLTDTKMAEGIIQDEDKLAKFRERMALEPPIDPADVAAVIAFLASDDARMVTGVVLPVDGGVTAANGQPRIG